tara:strand:- start:15008 stop:15571 length:564 start_codon:yes stop_codon:yes gene_type:complete
VLPILGQHDYETRTEAGKTISDTIHYTVPDFSFLGHRSVEINNNTIAGKVTIVDFFFTTCPTICPVMSRNMKKISQEFLGKKNLAMLSFSIDAIHDSIPVLNKYASKLNVENENWHFLVCEKKKTFELAKGFMISAAEDKNAPGGLIHSGAFILLDGQQRIRAYYDGTKEEDVDKAIADIKTLLDEI